MYKLILILMLSAVALAGCQNDEPRKDPYVLDLDRITESYCDRLVACYPDDWPDREICKDDIRGNFGYTDEYCPTPNPETGPECEELIHESNCIDMWIYSGSITPVLTACMAVCNDM